MGPFYGWRPSMYSSLTGLNGQRIFWYSDRKVFGLGRYITDKMLAEMTVPTQTQIPSLRFLLRYADPDCPS